jgi:hypothetical protein
VPQIRYQFKHAMQQKIQILGCTSEPSWYASLGHCKCKFLHPAASWHLLRLSLERSLCQQMHNRLDVLQDLCWELNINKCRTMQQRTKHNVNHCETKYELKFKPMCPQVYQIWNHLRNGYFFEMRLNPVSIHANGNSRSSRYYKPTAR